MGTEQTGFVNWIKSRTGLAFIGFAVIAVFFLWEEHKAHLLGALPYVRTPGAGARSVETFPGKRLRSAGRFSALLHHLVAHCQSLAIFGTAVANVGADSTNPGMVLGIAQHEICRGPADLGTLNQ
jgi:Protein of unknown function (DUF2933)